MHTLHGTDHPVLSVSRPPGEVFEGWSCVWFIFDFLSLAHGLTLIRYLIKICEMNRPLFICEMNSPLFIC